MDSETKEAIERIVDGSLADQLNKKMKYTMTGVGIGIVIGIIAALMTGKSRWMLGAGGAAIGGGVGYMSAPKNN